MSERFSLVGKSVPRYDALEKVKGEAKYVADIQLPGMLYARFLRSPHPHARITAINTTKAERLPGVKAVLTYRNVPKVHPRRKLEYLLEDTVRFAGEEVAVVAAVTEEIAEEALGLIDVEYEVLPAVFDAEEAMKPDAPLLYPDYGTNMFHGSLTQPVPRCRTDGWLPLEVGNVERGFAEADEIVEGNYETPIQHPCSPMPRSVVCQWTGDKLTCWADTQVPMLVWQDLANCLGMPQSSVRVIATYPVGGYGGKEPEKTATLAALLAKKTGLPVRAVFTREEDLIATHRRLNYRSHGKVGVKKDGTITAMEFRMLTNFGKDSTRAFRILSCSACYTCGMLYPCPNLKWEGCQVMTNTEQHAGFNGYGDPEAGFCLERLLDEAAEKIGMDPVEFRLKNCLRYGTRASGQPEVMGLHRVVPGFRAGDIAGLQKGAGIAIGDADTADTAEPSVPPEEPVDMDWGIVGPDGDSLQECLRKAAEQADWKNKWKGWKTPVSVNGTRRRGIGVALGIHGSGYRPYGAIVKMNQDGTATIMSSATEIGQGCATAMAEVVAEVLGIRYRDVFVLLADTAVTPAGVGNIGSCGTSSAISAAKYAAEDARKKIFVIVAKKLGTGPEDLEAKDRRIFVKGKPEMGMTIAEACFLGYQVTGEAVNPPQESIIDKNTGKVIHSYALAATIAEVEVDTETGELDLIRMVSAHDCGIAINPVIIQNQIDLSLTMGNGYARSEYFFIDGKTGAIMNSNLLDYKLLTILDMPKSDDLQEIIVENPCAWGPYGAKGMSETGTTTPAPAIANAIYNAIGVRIRGDSLTPETILLALGKC